MFLIDKTFWEIKKTRSRGKGVFAKKNIAAGTVIGDYTGKVLRTRDVDIKDTKKNLYLMYYSDQASIYPDLKKSDVHLLNHSCTPNACIYTYFGHILFFALRKIFAGEEITVSYMLSPQNEFCKPCMHVCSCESIMCSKSMHLTPEKYSKWRNLQDYQAKKTKRIRVNFDKNLPLLRSYPTVISDNPIYDLFGATTASPYLSTNSNLPSKVKIRKMIRSTGKTILFPLLHIKILGITENTIYQSQV